MAEQIITIKLRLKDKHCSELNRQARAVNFVWNYCNDIQSKAATSRKKWPGRLELQSLTAGSGPMLGLSAQTVCKVCERYELSRRTSNRRKLRFRGRKSLGWIPFNAQSIRFDGEGFVFRKVRYVPMHTRDELSPSIKLMDGSFNCDSRGRWYINVPIRVAAKTEGASGAVGIDLGLKALAVLSDGGEIEMPSFYRKSEIVLGNALRAGKTKRVRAIHAKSANRRKDFLHKASNLLAKKYGTIVIGDVNPSKMTKTNMAKSVNDAGWAGFKSMLSYKSIMNGGIYIEANEAYTSQTCSECGSLPSSRPKGIAGLAIREWTCDECGTVHDRDVNAARNILRIGLNSLVEGAAQMRSSHISSSDGGAE